VSREIAALFSARRVFKFSSRPSCSRTRAIGDKVTLTVRTPFRGAAQSMVSDILVAVWAHSNTAGLDLRKPAVGNWTGAATFVSMADGDDGASRIGGGGMRWQQHNSRTYPKTDYSNHT